MARPGTFRVVLLLALIMTFPATGVAGEKDTHYWLTMKLAIWCGFSLDEARLIAAGDWGMDENPTVAESDPTAVQDFVITNWPGSLTTAQRDNLRVQIQDALIDEGTDSKTEGSIRIFGEQLDDEYRNLLGGGGLQAELGVTPTQANNIFSTSQQHLFHTLPLSQAQAQLQIPPGQAALATRFTNVSNASRSEKLLKAGQFLHYLQDKWHHWPYITGSGHAGPTINGEDPDSAEDLHESNRYRPMVLDSMMWLGELARQLGVATHCSDGQPGVPLVGPWHTVQHVGNTANGELGGPLARAHDLVKLLDQIVANSDDGWKTQPLGWDPNVSVAGVTLWRDSRSNYEQVMAVLAQLIAAEIKNELSAQADKDRATVAQLEYPTRVTFDQNGDFTAPNADPAQAVDGYVNGPPAPNVTARGLHCLALAPLPGPQTRITGHVTVENVGTAASDPGTARIVFADFSNREIGLGHVEVAVPSLQPGETAHVPYQVDVPGDQLGRLVVAAGLVLVGDGTLNDNFFTDASIRFDVINGVPVPLGCTAVGPDIVAQPQEPLVPYLGFKDYLIIPDTLVRTETIVTFRVRFIKWGGPAGNLIGSVLKLHLPGGVTLELQQASSQVPFGPGFDPSMELVFEPVDLSPYLGALSPDDLPLTLPLGLEVSGVTDALQEFQYVHGPLYVEVIDAQPIAGTRICLRTGRSDGGLLTFAAKVPAAPLPGTDFVSDMAGTLRVFDTGGVGGDATWSLPAIGWSPIGGTDPASGFTYRGAGTPSDPCRKVRIKRGATLTSIRVDCRYVDTQLTTPFTGDAAVLLDVAGVRYCAVFDSLDTNRAGRLLDRYSAVPASCPTPP